MYIASLLVWFESRTDEHENVVKLGSYEFELSYNTVEATKNICCAEGESRVDDSTVQEISLGLEGPRRSGKVR